MAQRFARFWKVNSLPSTSFIKSRPFVSRRYIFDAGSSAAAATAFGGKTKAALLLGGAASTFVIVSILLCYIINSCYSFLIDKATYYQLTSPNAPIKDQAAGVHPDSPQEASTDLPAKEGFVSYSEVQSHNSATSCWVIINGTVYDVTELLETHPGGKHVILKVAGTDAT